jgi:DNA mismatch repair protein MutL
MGIIKRLPDYIANRIAAGEVVDRPASIVKELIENSIDAGAKKISIVIENAGIDFISISDDGEGMMPQDIRVSLERHSTSKIRDIEDLDMIMTMGFRGEALPSIASVSRMKIVSKPKEQETAWSLTVEDGRIIEEGETGAGNGTEVTVTRLFYHVPARRKFLKTTSTEWGHIERIFRSLALANFNIGFNLVHNQVNVFDSNPSKTVLERIQALFGAEIASDLVPVSSDFDNMTLWGFTGRAGYGRPKPDMQYFFLNGRPVRNNILAVALKKALATLLPNGLYPVCFIFLETSPDMIDVNVHPSKLEVRFRRESDVFTVINRAIRSAFNPEGFFESTSKSVTENKGMKLVIADSPTMELPLARRNQINSYETDRSLRSFSEEKVKNNASVSIPQETEKRHFEDIQRDILRT